MGKKRGSHFCACTYEQWCMHMHTYTHIHASTHAHAHTHSHTCILLLALALVWLWSFLDSVTETLLPSEHTHTHMHTHTLTHTYNMSDETLSSECANLLKWRNWRNKELKSPFLIPPWMGKKPSPVFLPMHTSYWDCIQHKLSGSRRTTLNSLTSIDQQLQDCQVASDNGNVNWTLKVLVQNIPPTACDKCNTIQRLCSHEPGLPFRALWKSIRSTRTGLCMF